MKKKEKQGYWSAQGNAFTNSFKNIARKEFLKSALFDLITIVAVLLTINLAAIVTDRISITAFPQLLEVLEIKQSGDQQAFENAVVEYGPNIAKIVWISLAVLAVASLLLIYFVSLFYGNAWLSALKKKFSRLFLRKYFILNLVWALFWIIIILLTMLILAPQAAAILIIIEGALFIYLDPVLRAVFDENKSLGKNLLEFFRIGKKLHWFVLYIISFIIFLIILLTITGLLVNIEWLMIIAFIILILLFIGWMRNYIIALVNEIKN